MIATQKAPRARSLSDVLAGPRFDSYTYSYPHKTAYRPFEQPIPLVDLWRDEDRSSLFLYLHVPFCEMRCGFCNLFTQVHPDPSLPERYVAVLRQQAVRVRDAIGEASYARVAFGGGTPTYLPAALLEQLFEVAAGVFGARLESVPVSLETSPETATPERLALARQRGVDRISIGIQSFIDDELKALGRPQTRASALAAMDRIAAAGFATVNVDLIYGARGQSPASWAETIDIALGFDPEELYLYPLYVRPLTGLGRRDRRGPRDHDARAELYERGRDQLLEAGYEQISLRMFRKPGSAETGPVYCCQEDGMVGLGCGARSYTRGVHWSDDWAVSTSSVKGIIADWVARPAASFSAAHYGIRLDAGEQRRRYLIQSLSIRDGFDLEAYARRFGSSAEDDFAELAELAGAGMLERSGGCLIPTAAGLAWADAIGPWLYSDAVRARMQGFELR